MKIGVIGTGNMGTIVTEALIASSSVTPSQLTITNRTIKKAEALQNEYPGIEVVRSAEDVIKNSQYIFICVKPLDIHPLLETLKHLFTKDKCLISITSPISVEQLESMVDCSVVRAIPSINNRALSGASLLTFGKNCLDEHKNMIDSMMKKISTPLEIEENVTRIASDIVSCGPAFFSFLLQKFIDAAVEETKISHEQATILASNMLVGMGQLIQKEIYTLPTLQEKVCVKGGITGEGIKSLENDVGEMFNNLIKSTHAKYYEDIDKIGHQFKSYTNK